MKHITQQQINNFQAFATLLCFGSLFFVSWANPQLIEDSGLRVTKAGCMERFCPK